MRGKTRNAKRTLSKCQEVFDLPKKRREKNPNQYWGSFRVPENPTTTWVQSAKPMTVSARIMDLYNLLHTFATRSIQSGTDVTILQKILGRSEIGMTMRYVKIAETLQG